MAITIDQSFITKFNEEVKHAYGTESIYMPHVRKHENVIGSTDRFQKIGGLTAYTKTRNADLTVQEPLHSYVDVTLSDKYVSTLIDKLDLLKTNVDVRREYVTTVSRALATAVDGIIRTAATAGSTTIATTAGGFTFAKLNEANEYFISNKVQPKDRILVIGPKQLSEAMAISQLTSADYHTMRAIMNGEINQAMGFTWIIDPDVEVVAGTPDVAQCFAYDKSALGVSVGANFETAIEWSPDKHAYWVKGTVSMGAAIVDGDGVVEVPCEQ